jgi:hypothetical protein
VVVRSSDRGAACLGVNASTLAECHVALGVGKVG